MSGERVLPRELDLRLGVDPGPETVRLLHQSACESQSAIVAAVDSLTDRLGGVSGWLYSAVAERNPLVSPLPYRVAGLALVAKLHREGRLPEVVVTDSPATARVLSEWAGSCGAPLRVELRRTNSRLAELVALARNLAGSAAWQVWTYLAARFSGPAAPLPKEPAVLLDAFVLRGGPVLERYFPGLLESLSDAQRARTYLVPTVFGNGFRGFVALFRRLREAENCVLKESYLPPRDLLAGLLFPLGSLTVRPGTTLCCGFDIAGMVTEELRTLRNYSSMVTAWLNERFALRLAAAGVRVERTVSWYENQAVDKGWQRGFSRSFPEARRIGYQGYVPEALLGNLYPSAAERQAGVLPDELAVMGPLIAEQVGRFCPELAVRVAPAFRFRYLTEEVGDAARPAATRVVAPLPMSVPEARRVLTMLVGAAGSAGLAGYDILVKLHPATDRKALADLLDAGLPDAVRLVNDPMERLLPGSAALVSTASSVCIEALCMGVPVALLARPGALLLSPLPESLEGGMWRLCVTQEDLERSLEGFLSAGQTLRARFAPELERLRRGLFLPVTSAGARALLGFAPDKNTALSKEE